MDVEVCKHYRSLLPLWVLGEHQIELLLIEKSPFYWVLERTNILVVNNINFWGFQSIPTNLFKSPCYIKHPLGSLELAHCHFCLIQNKVWLSPMSRWKHTLHLWWEELATSLGKGNAYREGWIIEDNDAISQEGETRERPAPEANVWGPQQDCKVAGETGEEGPWVEHMKKGLGRLVTDGSQIYIHQINPMTFLCTWNQS